MTLSQETLRFIRDYRHSDVRALALQARRHPGVDMPAALAQIAGWQVATLKIPSWAGQEGIIYPPHLSMEQCSSERTARYKAGIVDAMGLHDTLVDLTGGFGIDCSFLAASFRQVTYVERQEALCSIATHNFSRLGLKQITVSHADALTYLPSMPAVDWIFIDPARRDNRGGKTVAITDCDPDVIALEPLLLEKARYVLVKLSPMLDLAQALHDLRHVQAVHVVSVAGECKELLLLLGRGPQLAADEVPVTCVNLDGRPGSHPFTFTRRSEQEAVCSYASGLQSWLYEPHSSLLKAGAFRSVGAVYGVRKLHPNSHLYTSDAFVNDFPGRIFRVTGCCGFGKREVRELLQGVPKANMTVRNFPATVAELRKRLKLAEGGDIYLFATTLEDGRKVLVRTEKADCICPGNASIFS